jgi:hypothetical protein
MDVLNGHRLLRLSAMAVVRSKPRGKFAGELVRLREVLAPAPA